MSPALAGGFLTTGPLDPAANIYWANTRLKSKGFQSALCWATRSSLSRTPGLIGDTDKKVRPVPLGVLRGHGPQASGMSRGWLRSETQIIDQR